MKYPVKSLTMLHEGSMMKIRKNLKKGKRTMQLWTVPHAKTQIIAIALMLVITVLLKLLLGKKEWRFRMIPIQVITVSLLLLEVVKQALSFARGYDLYHIPFHFCSIFIFIMPVMSFYRGKHKNLVGGVTAALCASVFLLMVIYPNLIFSEGDAANVFGGYFAFHTVVFHNLVMLSFLLITALRLHEPAPAFEVRATMLFMTGFCIVAGGMSQILRTNYANMYSCNVPVIEDFRLHMQGVIGNVPTQILYVLAVSAAHILFALLSYGFYRLVRYLQNRWSKPQKI